MSQSTPASPVGRRRPWGTPTLHLTGEFVRAARTRPLWMLAAWGGFPDIVRVSRHLCSGTIKGTPLQIERMLRIADALQFPREQVFVQPPESEGA